MATKIQIKPIKNNPLFAKLKAKKRQLKALEKKLKSISSNNNSN